jgi:hypothetical protein
VVQDVLVPFVDTPLTSNVREAVERDWSTNLNGPAVRLYGGGESAAFRVGDGMLEAERNFRRVRGCKDMPTLVAALARHAAGETVTPTNYDQSAA